MGTKNNNKKSNKYLFRSDKANFELYKLRLDDKQWIHWLLAVFNQVIEIQGQVIILEPSLLTSFMTHLLIASSRDW